MVFIMVVLLQFHVAWESGANGKGIQRSEDFTYGFQLQAVLWIRSVPDTNCCWMFLIPSAAHCRDFAQETHWWHLVLQESLRGSPSTGCQGFVTHIFCVHNSKQYIEHMNFKCFGVFVENGGRNCSYCQWYLEFVSLISLLSYFWCMII